MNEFKIGQIFEGTYPPKAARWCNTNHAFIEEIDSISAKEERQELVREEQYIEEQVIREEQYIEAILDDNGEVITPAQTIPAEVIPSKIIPAEYKTIVEDVTVRRFQIVALPAPTAEELAKQALASAKAERAAAVASITVEVDGMVFDGDEVAQERMARTITAATATGASMDDITTWVLHNNTVATVTIRQLASALRLAGEEQTRLWTVPYEASYTPAEVA